jgi:hypothetical protein
MIPDTNISVARTMTEYPVIHEPIMANAKDIATSYTDNPNNRMECKPSPGLPMMSLYLQRPESELDIDVQVCLQYWIKKGIVVHVRFVYLMYFFTPRGVMM